MFDPNLCHNEHAQLVRTNLNGSFLLKPLSCCLLMLLMSINGDCLNSFSVNYIQPLPLSTLVLLVYLAFAYGLKLHWKEIVSYITTFFIVILVYCEFSSHSTSVQFKNVLSDDLSPNAMITFQLHLYLQVTFVWIFVNCKN